jgi:UDP-glucose 4-epimerase
MKVLITGGAGFIGSNLADRLLSRGDEVFIIDNLSTGVFSNIRHMEGHPRFHVTIDTVQDQKVMKDLVGQCDVIYHLAAAVGVQYVIDNPLESLINNIRGTEIVLEQANAEKKKVILASSSEIYGKKNGRVPFREDDDRILGPTTVIRWSYSTSKAVDELLALAYWREKKLPTVIVRFFNVIGPRQTGRYGMVVPRFVKQALLNHPITVYGDGEQRRCFTDIDDALDGLIALAENASAVGEIYNLGSNFEISIRDLAFKIKEMTQSASPIKFIPYEEAFYNGWYEDLQYRVPNLDKIKALIDYNPKFDLDATIQKIIAYHES